MLPNMQETADLVTITKEKSIMKNFTFCAVWLFSQKSFILVAGLGPKTSRKGNRSRLYTRLIKQHLNNIKGSNEYFRLIFYNVEEDCLMSTEKSFLINTVSFLGDSEQDSFIWICLLPFKQTPVQSQQLKH